MSIPEEVECRLQKGVPSCSTGTAKRNILREIRTQGNCGPRKELAAAGRRMTCCANVAQQRRCRLRECSHQGPSAEQGRRKNQIRNKSVRGNRKERSLGRRQQAQQGCNKGIRKGNLKDLRLGSAGNTIEAFKKTTGLENARRIATSTVVLRTIKNWALERDWPPPKRLKSPLA
jgi:hypothetical protein